MERNVLENARRGKHAFIHFCIMKKNSSSAFPDSSSSDTTTTKKTAKFIIDLVVVTWHTRPHIPSHDDEILSPSSFSDYQNTFTAMIVIIIILHGESNLHQMAQTHKHSFPLPPGISFPFLNLIHEQMQTWTSARPKTSAVQTPSVTIVKEGTSVNVVPDLKRLIQDPSRPSVRTLMNASHRLHVEQTASEPTQREATHVSVWMDSSVIHLLVVSHPVPGLHVVLTPTARCMRVPRQPACVIRDSRMILTTSLLDALM
jgi:hypothetical protein